MNLFGQLIAILAVVVGGVLSYTASAMAAKAEWRRTIGIRWDRERLAAHIDFANTAKKIAMVALRIAVGRGIMAGVEPWSVVPLEATDGEASLAEAETSRSVAFEGVLLLGDTDTIANAQVLNERLWSLQSLARSQTLDRESWVNAFVAYRQARADFYQCARRSMGVPKAEIPLARWMFTGGSGLGSNPTHANDVQ